MKLLLALSVSILAVLTFNLGLMYGLTAQPVNELASYTEVPCDDIVSDGHHKWCEVNMVQEDDNLRIFKGK